MAIAILLLSVHLCGAAWCRPKGTGSCEGNLQERHEKELLSLGYLEPAWPQLVDVDGDGKMELLLMVTDGDGSWNVQKKSWIRYFRQVDGQLVEQFGANNVFRHVNFSVRNDYGAPCFAVVDWDSDGDLDLILQDNAGLWLMDFDMDGNLHNRSAISLVNKLGEDLRLANMGGLRFAAVDFDADGDVDILTTGAEGWLVLFKRKNPSTVMRLRDLLAPWTHFSIVGIAVADFDGDGALDVMLTKSCSYLCRPPRFAYLHRTADGHFEDWSFAANPLNGVDADSESWDFSRAGIAAGDWDGDGRMEILLALKTGKIQLLSWKSTNRYIERSKDFSMFQITRRMAHPQVADWDGDGDLDFLLGSKYGKVEVFLRSADGSLLQAEEVLQVESHSTVRPAAIDWNYDGRQDLLVPASSEVWYFERQANGSLAEKLVLEGLKVKRGVCYAAAVADWDGDGRWDILLACSEAIFEPRLHWEFFQQLPDGRLAKRPAPLPDLGDLGYGLGSVLLQAIDFDADGRTDLLMRDLDKWRYFHAQEDLRLVETELILPNVLGPDTGLSSFVFVDWDSDGDLDLLTAESSRDPGPVRHFEYDYCRLAESCSSQGFCSHSVGTCLCFPGHTLADCSACSPGYFDLERVNVSIPSELRIRKCSACPGLGEASVPCSGRGICNDDLHVRAQRWQSKSQPIGPSMPVPTNISHFHGDGTCVCEPPFSGENCEMGLCLPGHKYVQSSLWRCEPCMPGSFLSSYGLQTYCNLCTGNAYAPSSGSKQCVPCESKWWRTEVNGERTSCEASFLNLPACAALLLLSFLLFAVVPFLANRPMRVADVQLKEGALTLTTSGRHWLLKPVKVTFLDTSHPLLDSKTYIVKAQNDRQLRVCDTSGSALTEQADASRGTCHVQQLHHILRRGILGMPFVVCFALLILATAAYFLLLGALLSFQISLLEVLMLLIGALLAVAVHWWFRPGKRPLERDLCRFAAQSKFETRQCPKGPGRAICLQQLEDLYSFFSHHIGFRNMYYLCSNLVKPLTMQVALSYAELVGPSSVQWFVSHFWGMPFEHFIRCLKGHVPVQMTSYWICTFSNNQWKVSEELGHGNVEDSSFYLALRGGCQGTLFVLDEEVLPLTRSWCLFELFQTELLSREVEQNCETRQTRETHQSAFQLLLGTSSGVMNYGESSMDLALKISKKLATLRLQDAQASCPEDKVMINEAVSKHPGGFQAVNAFLFEAVKLALQQTELRFRTDVAQLQEDLASACPPATEPVLLGRLNSGHQTDQTEGKD